MFRAAPVASHTCEDWGILLPNFSFVLCLDNQNASLFLFQNTMRIPPSPPPSSENSQTGPGEKYKRTKRQAKQALCSALNHFLSQVQPLCIILPWLIEWVCVDWGEPGRLRWGPVIWAPSRTTCREKEILCKDWIFREF